MACYFGKVCLNLGFWFTESNPV